MTNLSIGSVLGRSFSIFGKNIVSFLLLGILLHIPSFYFVHDALDSGSLAGGTNPYLIRFIEFFSGQMLAATLTYGTVMELRGMHASVGKCIQVGLSRALPVMLVSLLVVICTWIGTLLLIIPGIIVMTMLYVAVPVAVLERPGIMASLSRSSELTRGFRLKIFGLGLLLVVSAVVVVMVLTSQFESAIYENLSTYMYGITGLTIFMAVIGAVVASVVYHDLRAIKDGVNIDELAAVFD